MSDDVTNYKFVTVVSRILDYVEEIVAVFHNRKLAEDWVKFYIDNPEAAALQSWGTAKHFRIAERVVVENFDFGGALAAISELKNLEEQQKNLEILIKNKKQEFKEKIY